ncbi:MAG: RidA family protein [Candidatus Zixiibacteriota bacterium]
MFKKVISTANAPKAIGPYSQGIILTECKNLVYCSGQIPIDPATGNVVEANIAVQTKQVFSNIRGILAEAGSALKNVIKTTVFLKNMDDFKAMNDVYAAQFDGAFPARSTVQVAKLPLDVLVEIEVIAYVD